jgi:putative PIN family toxin of toxin-antitoxin system
MIYAVIDTNVFVSALLSRHLDSGTVVVRNYVLEGLITPLYNEEIFQEYLNVLHRPRLGLPSVQVDAILDAVSERGIMLGRTKTEEVFPDPKDIVFYEVALSREDAYLVTGNTKHFPKTPIVVTPAELLAIIQRGK